MTQESQQDDIAKLIIAMERVQELQALATKYGIDDIFQDNGGKVLQSLILLGLKSLPGREGNDAVDADGNEYELKTINIKKQRGVTTHHHLNAKILAKYRKVKAWYISLYEGITLVEIYNVPTDALETLFQDWEKKLENVSSINNPKIPLAYIYRAFQRGEVVRLYPQELEGTSALERVGASQRQPRKIRETIHTEIDAVDDKQPRRWEDDLVEGDISEEESET